MAKAVITAEEHGKLSADLKAEYRPGTKEERTDGKFMLKVEAVEGYALEHAEGLKNSLSAAREERDEARRGLSAFEGIDPKEARGLAKKVKEMEGWTPEKKMQEKIDAEKATLQAKYDKDVSDLKNQITQRDAEVDELLIDSELTRVITAKGASLPLLKLPLKAQCKVIRPEGGKPKAIVLQADGKSPRLTEKSGSQEQMTLEELVEITSKNKDYAPAFPGTKASGTQQGGKQPQRGGTPQRNGTAGGGQGNDGNGDERQGAFGQSAVDRLKESRRAEHAGTAS